VPLSDDPADLVHDHPVRRELAVEVLSVVRHVPGAVRATLVEFATNGDTGGVGDSDDADGQEGER
jgi:hypothetical protein